MKPLITPSLNEFLQLAKQGNVIPVFAEFVGDCETPVSAFKKFSRSAFSFLFESTEKNDVSGRFSFVGFDPRIIIQSHGREMRVARNGIEERFSTTTDPLDEVRKLMARYQFVSHPELPRFAGGAVGFLGYEAVRFFEPKVLAARQKRFMRALSNRWIRLCNSCPSRSICRLFPLCTVKNSLRLAVISVAKIFSAQWSAPRNTSAQATSSRSSYRNDSNLRLMERRSIFIAVFVSSTRRRTCFV